MGDHIKIKPCLWGVDHTLKTRHRKGYMRPEVRCSGLIGCPASLQWFPISWWNDRPEPELELWSNVKAAVEYLVEALVTEGGHHKQWYIEKALSQLGATLPEDYEEGIAP